MDAALKHVGLRSDFIVCHPDVIDDPFLHAYRPPLPAMSSPGTFYFSHIPFPVYILCTFTGNFKHLQKIQEDSIDFLIT